MFTGEIIDDSVCKAISAFTKVMDYENHSTEEVSSALSYCAQHKSDAFVKNISVVCTSVLQAAARKRKVVLLSVGAYLVFCFAEFA